MLTNNTTNNTNRPPQNFIYIKGCFQNSTLKDVINNKPNEDGGCNFTNVGSSRFPNDVELSYSATKNTLTIRIRGSKHINKTLLENIFITGVTFQQAPDYLNLTADMRPLHEYHEISLSTEISNNDEKQLFEKLTAFFDLYESSGNLVCERVKAFLDPNYQTLSEFINTLSLSNSENIKSVQEELELIKEALWEKAQSAHNRGNNNVYYELAEFFAKKGLYTDAAEAFSKVPKSSAHHFSASLRAGEILLIHLKKPDISYLHLCAALRSEGPKSVVESQTLNDLLQRSIYESTNTLPPAFSLLSEDSYKNSSSEPQFQSELPMTTLLNIIRQQSDRITKLEEMLSLVLKTTSVQTESLASTLSASSAASSAAMQIKDKDLQASSISSPILAQYDNARRHQQAPAADVSTTAVTIPSTTTTEKSAPSLS